jgi:biotin synthase
MQEMLVSRHTAEAQGHETPTHKVWHLDDVAALYALPFNELMFRAQLVHREHHRPDQIQLSSLLSIKTGGCPEDCGYCPQSSNHDSTGADKRLMAVERVVEAAKAAKAKGSQRFCMGAAWRSPTEKQLDDVVEMISAVKALGMETCVTLGMLKQGQAQRLRDAGLDYYNHNLDTSPEHYGNIISTRTYQDRLDTLERVREAGLNVCCGGILGMGESRHDRAALIAQLANLNPYPESVPINQLVRVAGTPLQDAEDLDPLEFVRTIAVARITMPRTMVRLSAGREAMSDELQTLCLLAGANSIFYGEQLLTTPNPQADRDMALIERLGMQPCTP